MKQKFDYLGGHTAGESTFQDVEAIELLSISWRSLEWGYNLQKKSIVFIKVSYWQRFW